MSNSPLRIAVVVGSLRKESLNRRMADALARLVPAGVTLTQLRIDDLPPYNQDDDGNPHASVVRLRGEVKAADGVIFLTPEYNRSIPGVLKNALDHASRPWGQSVWKGKPAGILGVSVGVIGTATAQQHLRNIVAYLDMPTLNQPEMYLQATETLFDGDGGIGTKSRELVQKWVDAYVAWVRRTGTPG